MAIRYYRFITLDLETLNLWDLEFRKQVITRLDSIMFGVLGAYCSYYHEKSWLRHKKGLLFLGLVLLFLYKILPNFSRHFSDIFPIYKYVFSFALVAVGTLLLLPFLSTYKHGSGRIYRWLTTISLISYSMYLINLSVVIFIALPMVRHLVPFELTEDIFGSIIQYVLFWVFTIVGSMLIYKYFEMPMTKLREKISVKKS